MCPTRARRREVEGRHGRAQDPRAGRPRRRSERAAPAVLIAFAHDPTLAAWTALLFLVFQQLEGNVLQPVIQKRATALPPVLTILAVVGFGVLFGLVGVLVATPLLLVILITVRMLYVEDTLGDRGKDGREGG